MLICLYKNQIKLPESVHIKQHFVIIMQPLESLHKELLW